MKCGSGLSEVNLVIGLRDPVRVAFHVIV